MKKTVCIILTGVLCIGICAAVFSAKGTKDIVRIHIRANGDTPQEQADKLRVRDEVNQYLAPLLASCKSKEEACCVLSENLEAVQAQAQAVSELPVSIRLEEAEFPEKTYGDKVYPAGMYTALVLEIGSGEGQNWWCVAYPPLCYTTRDGSGAVTYRSWIVELLERLGIV